MPQSAQPSYGMPNASRHAYGISSTEGLQPYHGPQHGVVPNPSQCGEIVVIGPDGKRRRRVKKPKTKKEKKKHRKRKGGIVVAKAPPQPGME